MNELPKNH